MAALAQRPLARRFFRLHVRPNGLALARLGIVVARKAVRGAVERNRVKRLVREVFRTERTGLSGLDIVVRVWRCPGREEAAAAREELRALLRERALAGGR